MAQRETFGSGFAVVMAMAGSAIGLGNIWRFPYTVGEGGGAAFIIVYLVSSLLLSLPIFMAESIIGRHTHSGTIGSMKKLAPGTKWKWLGFITFISPLILVSYYSVVGGWSFDFLFKSLTLQFNNASPGEVKSLFGNFITKDWAPVICHTVFLALTCLIVMAGVKKGIEKFSKMTMPMLFVLIVVIMLYAISLPGAGAGLEYMLKPDFSKLSGKSVASAMGQSFFSLSLGVGTILTYSSYIDNRQNILKSGFGTAVFDLMFALIAGFAVMPAVFAAGIEPGAGPGLIFETLPFVFSQMANTTPWLSAGIAILFFLTISIAALTSSISMIQVGVTYLTDEKGMSRMKACSLLFGCTWALGTLCSLSFGSLSGVHIFGQGFFDLCDKLVSNYLMATGGLFFTLFVGWKMSKNVVRNEFTGNGGQAVNGKLFGLVYFLIKWIAPLGIIVIFITNLVA